MLKAPALQNNYKRFLFYKDHPELPEAKDEIKKIMLAHPAFYKPAVEKVNEKFKQMVEESKPKPKVSWWKSFYYFFELMFTGRDRMA